MACLADTMTLRFPAKAGEPMFARHLVTPSDYSGGASFWRSELQRTPMHQDRDSAPFSISNTALVHRLAGTCGASLWRVLRLAVREDGRLPAERKGKRPALIVRGLRFSLSLLPLWVRRHREPRETRDNVIRLSLQHGNHPPSFWGVFLLFPCLFPFCFPYRGSFL